MQKSGYFQSIFHELAGRFSRLANQSSTVLRGGHSDDAMVPPVSPAPNISPVPKDWASQNDTGIPTYPPFRQGLPVVPASSIVASQETWIRNLYRASGVTKEDWKQLFMPVIHAYASHAHLLPASESNHHRGAGGLFRHGVESAFYAIRRVDGKKIAQGSHAMDPVDRNRKEERMRFAVFCAGLLHDAGKPITDMIVSDASGDHVWNPFLENLEEWALDRGIQRYHIHWRPNRKERHESVAALLLMRMVGKGGIAWLHEAGPDWVDLLSKSLAAYDTGANDVRDLAVRGDQESTSNDLKENTSDITDIGVPIERYVIDTMRRFLFENSWRVNETSAQIWVCKAPNEEGDIRRPFAPGDSVLALVWPRVGEAVSERLSREGMPGIPRDPNLIADMLLDRNIAVPAREGADGVSRVPYWFMLPPQETDNGLGAQPDGFLQRGGQAGQRVLVLPNPELLLNPPPPPSGAVLYASATRTNMASEPAPSATSATSSADQKTKPARQTQSAAKSTPAEVHPAATSSHQRMPGGESSGNPASASPKGKENAASAQSEPADAPRAGMAAPDETEQPGSRILRLFTLDVAMGNKKSNLVLPAGDAAILRFPAALDHYGMKPIEALKWMHAEGLVASDPSTPEILTQKMTLPDHDAPQTVVVLTRKAVERFPCLSLPMITPDQEQVLRMHRLILDAAPGAPDGKYVADREMSARYGKPCGYWYMPIPWTITVISRHFPDLNCPGVLLRGYAIGPLPQKEGLFLKFTTEPEQ